MKNLKYRIGSDLFALFPIILSLLIFGGVSIWLYIIDNGVFIFTGLIAALLLAILIYTLYSYYFVKISVYEDGINYQKGIGKAEYHSYSEIAELWISEGRNTNGATSRYLNFKLRDGNVIKFYYSHSNDDAVEYLKFKINGDSNAE